MSDATPYRRKYEDERLDEAYRLWVDGKLSQGDAAKFAGIGKRTLARHSSADKWKDERTAREAERAAVAAETSVASAAALLAPCTSSGAIDGATLEARLTEALNSDDVKQRIGAVMYKQRRYWDRIADLTQAALDEMIEKAAAAGKRISIGQLFPYVALGEKVATAQRKAHGIPDVTKLEFEDKTPVAKLHADIIRKRREERQANMKTIDISPEVAN